MNQSDNIVTTDMLVQAQIAAQLVASPAMIPTCITASIEPALKNENADNPRYEA